MVPVGRAILLRITPKDQLLQSIALLSIPALLGPTLGPPLGGFLVTYFPWYSIFLINIPIGLLVIVLVFRFVENDVAQDRPALDWKGFGLSGIALFLLLLGLNGIGNRNISGLYVVLLFGGGLTSSLLYARHARRITTPIIDLSLLRIQTFSVSIFAGNLCRLSAGAMPFLLAIQLQLTFGLPPVTAGLIIFTSAAGALAMKPLATRIINRAGFRAVLIANSVLAGSFVCACGLFTIETPLWLVAGVLFVGGTIRSLLFTAINTIGYADLPNGSTNRASSFAAMGQHTALSIGVGCAALILDSSMAWRGAQHTEQVDVMWAFFAIGASTVLASAFFAQLPRNVGEHLKKQ